MKTIFLRVKGDARRTLAAVIKYDGDAECVFCGTFGTLCEAVHCAGGYLMDEYRELLLPLPLVVIKDNTIAGAVKDILKEKGFKVILDRAGLCDALDRHFNMYEEFGPRHIPVFPPRPQGTGPIGFRSGY